MQIINSSQNFDIISKIDLQKSKSEEEKAITKINKTVGWAPNSTQDRISIQRFRENQNITLFAIFHDKIKGYVTAKPVEQEEFYVSFIAVKPKYQKGGVGKALMTTLFKQLRDKNIDTVTLDYRDRPNLNHFYGSLIAPSVTSGAKEVQIMQGRPFADGEKKKICTYKL